MFVCTQIARVSSVLRSIIERVGLISFDELIYLILRTHSLKFPAATATSALMKAKQQSSCDVNKIMQSL